MASNLTWEISIDPTFPNLLISQTKFSGIIEKIESNETRSISSSNILGFGPIEISIFVDDLNKTMNGCVFGPLIKIHI